MTLSKKNSYPHYACSIKASNKLTISSEPIKINNLTKPEMIQIGNHHCLLNSILKHYKNTPLNSISLFETSSVRLQRDVTEMLEIISSLEPFEYPVIKVSEIDEKTVLSNLDLKIEWAQSSYFPYTIGSESYKFIRLLNVKMSKIEDHSVLYTVPTSNPAITAFFYAYSNITKELLMELKGFKTDLFYKIENVIKGITADKDCEELWIPGFQKNVEWDML